MSAGLGSTADPRALIPGDPQGCYGLAGELAAYAGALEMAGQNLRRIDDGGWEGAAADAFRRRFHTQPGRWLRAAGAFTTAAQAMETYAATLAWAQGQAEVAIGQWHAGDHKDAQETLEHAQLVLAGAARHTSHVVGRAADEAPPEPGFWSEVGSFFSGVGRGAEHIGADVAGSLASFGNAMINNPLATAEAVGGAALAGISAGGEGLGLVLDATGVGAVAGVPLDAVSAAGMAAGGSLATAGLSQLAAGAAGPDRVSPLQMNASSTGTGSGAPDPNFGNLRPAEQETLVRLQQQYPDEGLQANPEAARGGPDYVDSQGRAWDQMGNPQTSQFWGQQKQQFMAQISRHAAKYYRTVVDLTGFTSQQVQEVKQYIDSLPEAEQAKIIRIGF